MPVYAFTVTDPRGERSTGTVMAPNQKAAMTALSGRGMVVTRLRAVTSMRAAILGYLGLGTFSLSGEQLISFTQQLAAMLEAGMTVKSSLEIMLRDASDPSVRQLLLELGTGLAAGSSLTELLSAYPYIFSEQYVAMVSAGESGGELPLVLTRLVEFIERSEYLRKRVEGALFYPALIAALSLVLVIVLFTFGIPRFQQIYQGFGGELPFITRLLMSIGEIMSASFVYACPVVLVLLMLTVRFSRTHRGRLFWDTLALHAPVLGPLFRRLAIARFARTFATLHSSGVSTVNALDLVAGSMGNLAMARVVRDSVRNVLEGEPMAEALKNSGYFTDMAISMLSAGEQTGTLDRMLDKVADFYEAQVDITLRALTGLVEPLVLIFVGSTVGLVLVALILPVFRLATLLFEK